MSQINGILLYKYHTLVTHEVLLKGYVIQHKVCQLHSWNVPVKAVLNKCTLINPVTFKIASLHSNNLV
jgi:hypothetical protein